jgi:hypothetical protein
MALTKYEFINKTNGFVWTTYSLREKESNSEKHQSRQPAVLNKQDLKMQKYMPEVELMPNRNRLFKKSFDSNIVNI